MRKPYCFLFSLIPLSTFCNSVQAAEILETRFGTVIAKENEEITVNGTIIQHVNKEEDYPSQKDLWTAYIGPIKSDEKDYVIINYRVNGLYCREQYRMLELAPNAKSILSELLADCNELSNVSLKDDGLLLEFRPSIVCDENSKCTPEDTSPTYRTWRNGKFSEIRSKPN